MGGAQDELPGPDDRRVRRGLRRGSRHVDGTARVGPGPVHGRCSRGPMGNAVPARARAGRHRGAEGWAMDEDTALEVADATVTVHGPEPPPVFFVRGGHQPHHSRRR